MTGQWVYCRLSYRLASKHGEDMISGMTLKEELTIEEVAKKVAYWLKRQTSRSIEELHHDSEKTLIIEFLETSQVDIYKTQNGKLVGEHLEITDKEKEQIKDIVRRIELK